MLVVDCRLSELEARNPGSIFLRLIDSNSKEVVPRGDMVRSSGGPLEVGVMKEVVPRGDMVRSSGGPLEVGVMKSDKWSRSSFCLLSW